jgi:hypothetical protein
MSNLRRFALMLPVLATFAAGGVRADSPAEWRAEWPKTDFARHAVPLAEIRSIIAKDAIPAVDAPRFASIAAIGGALPDREPVVTVALGGKARAYPVRILTWHEIVNDELAGTPIAVTFCPLCNSALVFDRRVGGRTLDFGVTGKLRNSDLVMYDRQTESWWQQFTGQGLVGQHAGTQLVFVPMRLESYARFKARHPAGEVMLPPGSARPYGRNPYAGYDSSRKPFLYSGPLPEGVAPLERVVVVGEEAWTFGLLMKVKRIERRDLLIMWEPGQASALDQSDIAESRDVGNVVVQRRAADGAWIDTVHDVSFAFAFRAFHPKGTIHKE